MEHSWPVPPKDGYTVDDLLTLPDLPRHAELIDGSLVFPSPQRVFHNVTVDLLTDRLYRAVPAELRVRRQMTVVLDHRNGLEPDVRVIRAGAKGGPDSMYYRSEDVLLVVEVVSPDSAARDRDTKPHKYARSGIPHFWRVEMASHDQRPVVHVHELDPPSRIYGVVGTHHNRLKLSAPFPIDIDLTEIDNL